MLDSYSNDGNYTSRSLRNRTNLTVNQSPGKGLGSLSISGLIEDYWDDKRTNKSISVGYNGGFRNVNYYLGYSYNRYTGAEITQVRMPGRSAHHPDGDATAEQLAAGYLYQLSINQQQSGIYRSVGLHWWRRAR
nr:fimbrial outer membrane usher protein StiC [Klebsiella pneumoniae]